MIKNSEASVLLSLVRVSAPNSLQCFDIADYISHEE